MKSDSAASCAASFDTSDVTVPLPFFSSSEEHEATGYVTQVEYYASLPAEAWILLEDSVAPVTDGWYGYFWEEENNDIQVEISDYMEFDKDGNFISVHPGLKVVIHRDDDGSLTGMVYHVSDEFRYDPEG